MEVILFRSSANSSDLNHPWGRLPPEQRPQARFIDLDQGLAKAKQQLESITDQRKLVFAYPCEWMDGLECVVDPSLAFRLESKRFLCQNNIPTPTLEMLSLHGEYLRRLETKELPFVVKFPQASSSYGTFLVTSSKQRKEMLASVERFRLRGGDEIQVSSYVKAKHNYCVQCFVSPDLRGDQPLIIAVTWQMFTGDGTGSGAIIDYAEQDDLRASLCCITAQTIEALPIEFVGWIGIDVLVDEVGRQYVIDLNPRMTGSMPICLLSRYFWKEQQLRFAQTGSFSYVGRSEDVDDLLREDVDAGAVVIIANVTIDDNKPLVQIWLVWAAADENLLSEMYYRICGRLGCMES
ncbi:uncharacterized protein RCC_03041 [Ramularia collo-cygni]|uniref:ATP-grasp domain-containing protein n=1 Tax=Ramularia collo-cygni TaxID=112498 RepID=A0A2D3V6U1_9PEZI|nr:uncharacterized protein RCC_03041 [Ramularia collo-cygni]CZT17209.1 uncharacterized protein RCC_03041 [Ramularia collo-cygni]